MPNAKVLSEKQAVVAAMVQQMRDAKAGVFVDYKGITVEADTKLRSDMRENNVHYAVIKNTLTRRAADELGFNELDPILNGSTSLATSAEDPIAPIRVISEFSKKLTDHFTIKAAYMDGKILSESEIKALADLPSKQVLQAQVLGTMLAPITSLAIVLKAIAEKNGGGAEEPAPAEAAAE